ncbi:MAG: ABC transporter substrate-binding protein [Proteobacteria bacterium]|nr:ABC transporter substrate-binding protein [Pseudomonadota bacterium]
MPQRRALIASVAFATVFAFGPFAAPARADDAPIRIGVISSQTGPAASLGIPQRNTVALEPATIGGRKVEYIVLDDGTDVTKSVAAARKLIDESNVDVIVGPSITPAALAMIDVAAEKKVPLITLAASAKIIDPPGGARAWVFKTPQNDSLMADAVVDHMAKAGIKTVAFIGFNDAYGDGWLNEMTRALGAKGMKLVDTEKYARADTSVTGQVLHMLAAKPDAVLIAGAGTPAVLPESTLRERGFKGPIYQTHGVANADFLRVGGKDVEGTILPAGPVLVAEQLPDSNPIKKVALEYVKAYEAKYGAGSMSTFGAHLYDAMILLQAAIPEALKKGQPGTPEFRAALRDALEGLHNVVLSQGVSTMSPTDHNGFDTRARVMVTIKDGKWVLLPE